MKKKMKNKKKKNTEKNKMEKKKKTKPKKETPPNPADNSNKNSLHSQFFPYALYFFFSALAEQQLTTHHPQFSTADWLGG